MKTLLVEKSGDLKIVEVEKPAITPQQALVKTIACGMCGTDVKLIHKTFKGFPEEVYPIMLGHEGVGEVVEVGSDVKTFKIGDKVFLPFVDPIGDINSGWGAISEYAVVHDPAAYPAGEAPDCAFAQTVIPAGIDPVDATMIITFREVLSSIRFFGVKPENSIVVFGCGPVGLTYIKFLNLCGIKNVIAVDIVDEKLKLAKEMGATYTINSKSQNIDTEVRKIFPDGVDFVLDAVGLPFVVNQAMSLICDRGAVLCYGVPEKEEITIDFSKAPYNWRVIYQQMPRKIEEGEASEQVYAWMKDGSIKIKDFISDYYDFDNSIQAYKDLLDKKIMKKGIIKF